VIHGGHPEIEMFIQDSLARLAMARAGNRRGAPAVNYSTGCQPLSELSSIYKQAFIGWIGSWW
jgi:hypothetical protein